MANRYSLQWFPVHFPHTSTAILIFDVIKRHCGYRPLVMMRVIAKKVRTTYCRNALCQVIKAVINDQLCYLR